MDYCQNLDLPHAGLKQVGDTYYYSPIWIYCLGIVDTSIDHLYAYVYSKSDGKRGGNNSNRILFHYLKNYVFHVNGGPQPIKELNVIMDNCARQNKNRMILWSAAMCIEMGWVNSVNLIFLVKGYTKNAADQCFSLLRKE